MLQLILSLPVTCGLSINIAEMTCYRFKVLPVHISSKSQKESLCWLRIVAHSGVITRCCCCCCRRRRLRRYCFCCCCRRRRRHHRRHRRRRRRRCRRRRCFCCWWYDWRFRTESVDSTPVLLKCTVAISSDVKKL